MSFPILVSPCASLILLLPPLYFTQVRSCLREASRRVAFELCPPMHLQDKEGRQVPEERARLPPPLLPLCLPRSRSARSSQHRRWQTGHSLRCLRPGKCVSRRRCRRRHGRRCRVPRSSGHWKLAGRRRRQWSSRRRHSSSHIRRIPSFRQVTVYGGWRVRRRNAGSSS